ncbi:MAG TPA: type VI secretion system contractile sheath large subunit [Polyangiales bacterium]|nr:type VI secretion system contractile sheath large subunit [Polyangiales bacterium]
MGRIEFDFRFPRGRARGDVAASRVLVIASLSGVERGVSRLHRIDVENFDDVLRALEPEVSIPGGAPQTLRFASLADFQPDALYEVLDGIAALRRSREQLSNPRTFEAERARLMAAAPAEDDASTLERLLGQRPAEPQPTAAKRSSFDDMLRELVAPHITRGPGAAQAELMASVDAALSDEMRRVLHTPALQRLEASWLGVRKLVFENPLGAELEVYVLDASREALLADLRACAGELERSQLYRAVVQPALHPDGVQYSLIVSDLQCSGSEEDVSLFAGLGAVAAQAGACLLAAADPALWGASDLSRRPERSAWSEPDPELVRRMALLRGSAVARFIGLCGPRILGRVPYGPKAEPVERFDFVELTADPEHAAFLWLNPAFACAQLILEGVAQHGWEDGPGTQLDLGDLPHVVKRTAAGDALLPCAEVFLDETGARQIMNAGVMPFLSYRNRNAVRLARLQSIADPPAPLALR